MPSRLSLSDMFASVAVPDTISYKLPQNMPYSKAPSHLVIDGFATLEMQRTRISVHGGKTLIMVDDAKRTPLHAVAQAGRPAGDTNRLVATGPAVAYGRGEAGKDKGLYTSWQMCQFGAAMLFVVSGAVNAFITPLAGVFLLAVGIVSMVWVLSKAAYNLPNDRLALAPAP